MITKNFEDYPEHRLKFFSLLRAIGTHCFQALIQLSSQVSSNLFCFLVLRWIIDLKYVNFRFYVLSDYWTIYFSNWSLWLTQLIGRSDIQREILQRQDLVYYWKFWRTFRWENMFHPVLSAALWKLTIWYDVIAGFRIPKSILQNLLFDNWARDFCCPHRHIPQTWFQASCFGATTLVLCGVFIFTPIPCRLLFYTRSFHLIIKSLICRWTVSPSLFGMPPQYHINIQIMLCSLEITP